MSNIPDFVMQVQEVQRQLEAQCEVTADDWRDDVKQRFYDNYINAYGEKLRLYIQGGCGTFSLSGISGKGLNDLLIFLDEQMQKMGSLTGVSADVSFMWAAGASYTGTVRDNYGASIPVAAFEEIQERDGVVHNEKLERDYWNEEEHPCDPGNGTRPGQYSNDEIKQIMDYRSRDDDYTGFDF